MILLCVVSLTTLSACSTSKPTRPTRPLADELPALPRVDCAEAYKIAASPVPRLKTKDYGELSQAYDWLLTRYGELGSRHNELTRCVNEWRDKTKGN